MKHIFIVNPVAGRGRGLAISKNIVKVCKEQNLDYVFHYTSKPKDATKFAEMYALDKNIIHSVGGDGTLSEVLNGIIGSQNMLGVIPAGSGNDFYKTLQNMKEITQAVDIGKVNDSYFINIASFGIDAEIANNVEIMKKRKIPRSQIYNFSIIYTLFKFGFNEIEFMLNNTRNKGQYTIVTVCNAQYYGGGYRIAPNAQVDDGLFDVYFVDRVSKLLLSSFIFKVKKGTHEKSHHVHKQQTEAITIKSKDKVCCNVDGEMIVDDKFDIKIVKNAITIYNNKELVRKIIDF